MEEGRTVLLIAAPGEAAAANRRAFEDAGMTVLHATDGLTGMRDALGDRPDAVVLDFAADDAPDVLRARRALRDAGIPLLVLVEGQVDEEEGRSGSDTIRFLRRPVEPHTLVSEARQVMQSAAAATKRAQERARHV